MNEYYRKAEFDGAEHDGLFNEELLWLAMEGSVLLCMNYEDT